MIETILVAEPEIRLTAFLGVLAAMALWEIAAPRRRRDFPRVIRWTNNLALVIVDTVILRLTFPILAVGLAVMGEDRGWGLFNNLDIPVWAAALVSMLLLDLAIYLQHVMFHAVPALWRLHRMHHADLDFDATTGLRFHPVEIVISMAIKLAVVAALGPPAFAVLLFEVILNATALFNHANINLPVSIDRWLRWVLVTPDMHRVHHSVDPKETNSNYGFNLPWWDRLLGTYVAQPAKGHTGMEIGIEQFRTKRDLWIDRMLVQPIRGPASGHALDIPKRTMTHEENTLDGKSNEAIVLTNKDKD
ncbi:sterol desaturase family protein [Primorskyibacter aestuariivivens]|uniref:sterol desaturase family protein n=1 Tax=Primorskyibacter aestuariivivens TaxID=1888912 RepID=UPI0023009CE9|nr:sterol desaturase family protein [Primorskyibacter aestuariivivens]MDA7429134.1 sterol desaturase family protein [Primorskyibacter aestuariivivens]